jgi:hypothetical protein
MKFCFINTYNVYFQVSSLIVERVKEMNRRILILSVIALFLMANLTSVSAETSFRVIGKVANGRDLGIVVHGSPSHLILFGDTSSEQVISGGPKSQRASNTGGTLSGLTITPINGDAQLWPGGVPTGAIQVGWTIYAFYEEGSTYGHIFDIAASGVVTSSDGGKSWIKHPLRAGNSDFSQCTPYPSLDSKGYILLYCTKGGRQGPAYLIRVQPKAATNIAAYQYYTRRGWSKNSDGAVPIIEGFVGELSISKLPSGKYIVLYTSTAAAGLVYSTSSSLYGPWSTPTTFLQWPPSGGSTYAPQIVSISGRKLIIFFTQWSDYSVYAGELNL